MKKRNFFAAIVTACAALCSFGLSASAATVEDVCDAMREIGAGESFIQSVRNSYAQEPHDENGMTIRGKYDTYTNWVEYIYIYEEEINDYLADHVFPDEPAQTTAATTAAAGASGSTVTQTTAVTQKPFHQMTLDEQKAYLASLSTEERAVFLASLTAEERKSILKQLSADDKAAVLAILTKMGADLGVHVAIDSIEGDTVSYSVRDDNGNLIDSAVLGYQVDSTGWNLTLPLLLSCLAMLLAVCGFVRIAKRGGIGAPDGERRSE